jgi:hypothetical protein
MKITTFITGSLILFTVAFQPRVTSAENLQDKTVRVIYLVSRDRQVQTNYLRAIEHAVRDLQGWYGRQLNGPTFKLHNPVVEVAHSSKAAGWFYGHANGGNKDDWGFNNTLAEAAKLLKARYNDPHYVWVIYSDGPGNKGRGTSGVTCLPEDDLLGLVGQHPTQTDTNRWIGGLGHELGHAFGLPHPEDTVRDADAIMWAGFYGKYPQPCYLTADDKKILLQSPFFFKPSGEPARQADVFVEKYGYAGGYFGRLANTIPAQWKEGKTDSSETYTFKEVTRDGETILINDGSRKFSIRIPIKGGESLLSVDSGKSWQKLYDVRKE